MLFLREEKIVDKEKTKGDNIRKLRNGKNVGQTEFLKQLELRNIDIIRETLVKIYVGRQKIKLDQLRGIKTILQVNNEALPKTTSGNLIL